MEKLSSMLYQLWGENTQNKKQSSETVIVAQKPPKFEFYEQKAINIPSTKEGAKAKSAFFDEINATLKNIDKAAEAHGGGGDETEAEMRALARGILLYMTMRQKLQRGKLRAKYKAGDIVETICTEVSEAVKLRALIETGEAELIDKVKYYTATGETLLSYRLAKDEERLSQPIPRGYPLALIRELKQAEV